MKTQQPRASLVGDTLVLAGRGITLMARSPLTVGMAALFPIILMTLLSVSFSNVVMPDAAYSDYLNFTVPLFATMGITFATQSTAYAAHADRVAGFDDRLRTLPISPIAPIAGRIIADTGRNLATVVIVTCVAMVLGFRFSNGIAGALAYFALPMVYGFGLAWMMVAVALRAKSAESANAMMNSLLIVLAFLSTGFVPLEDLPSWAQPLAQINPISHLVEAMRAFAHGGDATGNVLATFAWAIGLTVVFGALAARAFHRNRHALCQNPRPGSSRPVFAEQLPKHFGFFLRIVAIGNPRN